MKRKSLLIAAAAAAFVFAAPITAEAATPGWNQLDGSWFYADQDGEYVTDEWVENNQYYVDWRGVMVSDGSFQTSAKIEKEEDGYTYTTYEYTNYVFGKDGAVIKTPGWIHVGEDWYWINAQGGAGIYNDDAESNYRNKAGWVLDGGQWYYVYSDGRMATGTVTICDNPDADREDRTYSTYFCKPNGQMVTGWYNFAPETTYGSWVYCGADGKAHDGWLLEGGTWYYLNDGMMVTGVAVTGDEPEQYDDVYKKEDGTYDYKKFQEDLKAYRNSHRYIFNRNGAMVYGWYHQEFTDDLGHYSDAWYYADPNTGVAANGWVLDGGQWYYCTEGRMLRNTVFTDSDNAPESPKYPEYPKYPSMSDYTKEDGTTDWDAYNAAYNAVADKYAEDRRVYYAAYAKYEDDLEVYNNTHTYIFDDNGAMVTGWYSMTNTYGTTWYYADANGVGHTGWLREGGNWYYIERGVMLTNQFTPDGYFVDANGVCQ